MELSSSIDIAITVSTPEGIVTPVISDCRLRSLADVTAAMKVLYLGVQVY